MARWGAWLLAENRRQHQHGERRLEREVTLQTEAQPEEKDGSNQQPHAATLGPRRCSGEYSPGIHSGCQLGSGVVLGVRDVRGLPAASGGLEVVGRRQGIFQTCPCIDKLGHPVAGRQAIPKSPDGDPRAKPGHERECDDWNIARSQQQEATESDQANGQRQAALACTKLPGHASATGFDYCLDEARVRIKCGHSPVGRDRTIIIGKRKRC